jgi:hypothetical protein
MRALAAAALVALAAAPARAHDANALYATTEFRKDGTFAIDLLVVHNELEEDYGSKSPRIEIPGAPDDDRMRRLGSGVVGGFTVLFDGARVAAAPAWVGVPDTKRFKLRLTGAVPADARTFALAYDPELGSWAARVQYEGVENDVTSFFSPTQRMTPVELDPAYVPQSAWTRIREHTTFVVLAGTFVLAAAVAVVMRRSRKG